MATAEKEADTAAGDLRGHAGRHRAKRSLISGDNLKKFGLAAAAGVTAAGAGLFKLDNRFTEMNNTIRGNWSHRRGSGGLEQVALNVGKSVPASFDDIGTTVADLNTPGSHRPNVEKLSSQFP